MSGIFGLVNLDGAPIDVDAVDPLRRAMAPWGPDGVRVWSGASAALGQCVLFNTPEAVYERLPAVFGPDQTVLTAGGRIDNRDELCDLLRVPSADRAIVADGDLVVRAYERWGHGMPDRVLGDWACGVWHAQARQLFLARDHHGSTSLYYATNGRTFAFASDRRALLDLGWIDRTIHEEHLAQMVAGTSPYPGDATIYRGLRRLPPAHWLTAAATGISVRRYWTPETEEPVALRRDSHEELRAVLQTAVEARLRSFRGVGTTLSAGLDSGAVSVLAADAMRRANRSIVAFTAVPLEPPAPERRRIGNEWPLAAVVASAAGIARHVQVTAEESGPIAALSWMNSTYGEPVHGAANQYWIRALGQAARECDCGTLLTGERGNATISWSGVQPRAKRWLASVVSDVRSRFSAPSPAPSRFLSEALRARVSPRERTGARPGTDTTRLGSRVGNLLPGADRRCAWAAEFGAISRLELRDPTSDKRVIEFCFRLPDAAWRGPQDRWLIRRALEGWLPDAVRLERRRGRQSADLTARIARAPDEMEAVLATLTQSSASRAFLNIDALASYGRAAAANRSGRRIEEPFLRALAFAQLLSTR